MIVLLGDLIMSPIQGGKLFINNPSLPRTSSICWHYHASDSRHALKVVLWYYCDPVTALSDLFFINVFSLREMSSILLKDVQIKFMRCSKKVAWFHLEKVNTCLIYIQQISPIRSSPFEECSCYVCIAPLEVLFWLTVCLQGWMT